MEFSGITVAMQTVFDVDGLIDIGGCEELIDRYVDAGVHGILLSSGTGQHAYLTEGECDLLFSAGIEHIAGRVRVMCQTSALNQDEMIRRSQTAQDLGADGVLVLPPFFEGPNDDDGIVAWYAALDSAIDVDIVGYNIPAATGIELTPSLYSRLLELKRFTHIKDSSADIDKQQALIARGGAVLNGADPTTPFALMAGARGAIWGGANIVPDLAAQLYELITTGDWAGALEHWKSIHPLMNFAWQGDYIPIIYAAAKIMGYGNGITRAPVRPVGPDVVADLQPLLEPLR